MKKIKLGVQLLCIFMLRNSAMAGVEKRYVIYGDDNRLCPTEKFIDQQTPADCTGFLVAPSIIATAGHCVEEFSFCKDWKIVFGFMIDSKTRIPTVLKKSDVYSCKRIIHVMQTHHSRRG